MHSVVFHPRVIDDLTASFNDDAIKKILQKTHARLTVHHFPDGRVIKRLHSIATAIFFEYKVRRDWRAIFYVDEMHREIRIMGYIPKNVGVRLFDRQLETFLLSRYSPFSQL